MKIQMTKMTNGSSVVIWTKFKLLCPRMIMMTTMSWCSMKVPTKNKQKLLQRRYERMLLQMYLIDITCNPIKNNNTKQRHFKGITLHLLARIIAWLPVLAEIKLI
jgi:hypothetical protein